jgi:hypothetical protein
MCEFLPQSPAVSFLCIVCGMASNRSKALRQPSPLAVCFILNI